MRNPLLLLTVVLAISTSVEAENWPGWRGPRGDAVSSEEGLPTHWSPTVNVRWKIPLPGNGTSSPIVWENQVFVTATSGRDHTRLHVLTFDLRTGAGLWKRTICGYETPVYSMSPPMRGNAMPSPVTDGQRVVALFSTGELAAFDMQGLPLWFHSLQERYGPIDNDYGLAASPVMADGCVIVQVDHNSGSYLLAVDSASGKIRWKVARDSVADNWSSPLAIRRNGKAVVLCAGSRKVTAHDPATGKTLWTSDNLARLCCPTPIPHAGQVLLTSGPGGNVQCLALPGDLASPPIRTWTTLKGAGFVPSAVCVNGLYFYAADRGILSCLDVATGEEVWTRRMTGAFRGSPVAAGTHVFLTNLDGKTTIIKAAREYREVGSGDLGEPISASPAVSGGSLLFRTERHLIAVGRPDARQGSANR